MNSQAFLSDSNSTRLAGQKVACRMPWQAPELRVLVVTLDTGYTAFSHVDCDSSGRFIDPLNPGCGISPPVLPTDPSSGGSGVN